MRRFSRLWRLLYTQTGCCGARDFPREETEASGGEPPAIRACAWRALILAFSLYGLTGVGFGFRGGRRPSRPPAEAVTVRAAAARAATSCPLPEGGSASTSRGETRSRDDCAPAAFSAAPAARSDPVSAPWRPPPGCRRRASAASRPTGRASGAPPSRGQSAFFRHCQPALFSALNPVSIQKRISRHDAPDSSGGRSVRIIHSAS